MPILKIETYEFHVCWSPTEQNVISKVVPNCNGYCSDAKSNRHPLGEVDHRNPYGAFPFPCSPPSFSSKDFDALIFLARSSMAGCMAAAIHFTPSMNLA